MLHAISELPENCFWNIERILRDEVDADTLRSHQPHDLRDIVGDYCGQIGEQQMRFVKEENQLRLIGIACLRKPLEEIGQQPQQ